MAGSAAVNTATVRTTNQRILCTELSRWGIRRRTWRLRGGPSGAAVGQQSAAGIRAKATLGHQDHRQLRRTPCADDRVFSLESGILDDTPTRRLLSSLRV